ncbi:putative plasmid replication protein [Escherichia coli]|nr:putative plasmid replication protein [Escherichia coli]
MTQIDFQSLSSLSPFQLTQYIDDHLFTNEQKVQIFEHYHSTHKDTTNIYSRKENIKSIKKMLIMSICSQKTSSNSQNLIFPRMS